MDNLTIFVIMITLVFVGTFALYSFANWMSEKNKRIECECDLKAKDEIIKHLQGRSVIPSDGYCEYLHTKQRFMNIRKDIEKLQSASENLIETLNGFKLRL